VSRARPDRRRDRAVDGSRFKAVNTRDKNYTPGAIRLRMDQVEASIARYLKMLDTADRQENHVAEMRVGRLSDRLEALRRQMRQLQAMEKAVDRAGNQAPTGARSHTASTQLSPFAAHRQRSASGHDRPIMAQQTKGRSRSDSRHPAKKFGKVE
jgi:ABC-type phosphate transport system auxiliary subunit